MIMNKDVVRNAVICLANMKIEDTTYEIARDIVLEEYEEKDKEIERLNNIIDEIFEWMQNKYDNSDLTGFTVSFQELQDLKELKEGKE